MPTDGPSVAEPSQTSFATTDSRESGVLMSLIRALPHLTRTGSRPRTLAKNAAIARRRRSRVPPRDAKIPKPPHRRSGILDDVDATATRRTRRLRSSSIRRIRGTRESDFREIHAIRSGYATNPTYRKLTKPSPHRPIAIEKVRLRVPRLQYFHDGLPELIRLLRPERPWNDCQDDVLRRHPVLQWHNLQCGGDRSSINRAASVTGA